MAHRGLFFRLRADHEAGRIAQRDNRQIMRLAQLQEARGLVAGYRVDGPAQVRGIVGDQAEGLAFDADQRGNQPRRELAAQLQHAAGVGQAGDDLADVVDAQAVFRDQVAQLALVCTLPVGLLALEVGQVLLGDLHRLGFVFHQHVDHPVGALHAAGADFLGLVAAQAATFDHRRAGHADAGVTGGDDHIAAAEQRGVAGEAAPGHHAHGRHQPGQFGHADEGMAVQPGHADEIGITGPAAAALGEQHHRQPPLLGQGQHAVGLLVVHHALSAGEYRVVVGDGHAARGLFAELRGVDRADAGDQAIGRAQFLQFLGRTAAALGGQGHGAVFDEAVRVEQVGEVFPHRALAGLAPLGHGGRAARIGEAFVALQHFGQVGADMLKVDVLLAAAGIRRDLGRLDEQQRLRFAQGISGSGGQGADDAAVPGAHLEFHLHRLQHRDCLPGGHGIAFVYQQGDQHAAAWRVQGEAAGRGVDAVLRLFDLVVSGEVAMRMRLAVGGQQFAQMVLDEAGVDPVGRNFFALQQVLQQVQVARHAFQAHLAQGAIGAAQSARIIGGGGDQLGQQRVVGRAHRIAGIAVTIDAQTGAGGGLVGAQHAGGRVRAAIGVQAFQVQAQLYGTALGRGRLAQSEVGQCAAGGQMQLAVQQIDAGHLLGDGVLDLYPRVGLHEIEAAGAVQIEQKLEGADAAITHFSGQT